jgi:hypothetical protein
LLRLNLIAPAKSCCPALYGHIISVLSSCHIFFKYPFSYKTYRQKIKQTLKILACTGEIKPEISATKKHPAPYLLIGAGR